MATPPSMDLFRDLSDYIPLCATAPSFPSSFPSSSSTSTSRSSSWDRRPAKRARVQPQYVGPCPPRPPFGRTGPADPSMPGLIDFGRWPPRHITWHEQQPKEKKNQKNQSKMDKKHKKNKKKDQQQQQQRPTKKRNNKNKNRESKQRYHQPSPSSLPSSSTWSGGAGAGAGTTSVVTRAFVVPDGESVTLCPTYPYAPGSTYLAGHPEAGTQPTPRVSTARLLEDGWIRTDLCSRMSRRPATFANVSLVLLYDLDNAAGWFKINTPLPPSILLNVFCGSGGVHGSIPRQPLVAGHIPENRLFVTLCGGGKNAADFGITYAAGELNRIVPNTVTFAIVSNDGDFRHLLSHLRKTRPNSYQIKAHGSVIAQQSIHSILDILKQRINIDSSARARAEHNRKVVVLVDNDGEHASSSEEGGKEQSIESRDDDIQEKTGKRKRNARGASSPDDVVILDTPPTSPSTLQRSPARAASPISEDCPEAAFAVVDEPAPAPLRLVPPDRAQKEKAFVCSKPRLVPIASRSRSSSADCPVTIDLTDD